MEENMQYKIEKQAPKMSTVRKATRTGLLPEHALRLMARAGKLPALKVGNKILITCDKLCQQHRELLKEESIWQKKQKKRAAIITRGGEAKTARM